MSFIHAWRTQLQVNDINVSLHLNSLKEVQLLLRNSRSYLLIYSFKQKCALDAFVFMYYFCTIITRRHVYVHRVSVGGESCKIVFLRALPIHLSRHLLYFITDRQTDRDSIMQTAAKKWYYSYFWFSFNQKIFLVHLLCQPNVGLNVLETLEQDFIFTDRMSFSRPSNSDKAVRKNYLITRIKCYIFIIYNHNYQHIKTKPGQLSNCITHIINEFGAQTLSTNNRTGLAWALGWMQYIKISTKFSTMPQIHKYVVTHKTCTFNIGLTDMW